MDGGEEFIEKYLVKFSERESKADFYDRKLITPVPGFARAAILDVKNSIFQRMSDIARVGGSKDYWRAISGENGGIDRCDSTINHFIGNSVLTELLFMGKVGVYVDMPPLPEEHTVADERGSLPYFYVYKTEQIKNWEFDHTQQLTKVLLEEHHLVVDDIFGLPTEEVKRYRLLTKVASDMVSIKFFDSEGMQTDAWGNPSDISEVLNLSRLPFIIFELDQPLTRDIANHQIALLNMESADVSYALKANFPFYTEQQDERVQSRHLQGSSDNSETEGTDIDVGSVQGRRYAKGMDRPDFIHPSSEPLVISIEKQKQLKEDIRMLVNLALSNVKSKFASAESKEMDSRGLESGLSAIGMVLEHGERQLAALYSEYEGTNDIATIRYPERYSLKTDAQRLNEAKALGEQMAVVPSQKYHKAIGKEIVKILLDAKINTKDYLEILDEVEKAPYMSSDPETVHGDIERGIVSLETAAVARGYKKEEVKKAAKDHAERLARIKDAQSTDNNNIQGNVLPIRGGDGAGGNNSSGSEGARGTDPGDSEGAKEEKRISQDPETQEHGRKAVRGKANDKLS